MKVRPLHLGASGASVRAGGAGRGGRGRLVCTAHELLGHVLGQVLVLGLLAVVHAADLGRVLEVARERKRVHALLALVLSKGTAMEAGRVA